MQTEFADAYAISDDELAALALAADPDTVVGKDAVSLWDSADRQAGPLPGWYMPPASAGARTHPRWRRWVAVVIICAFIAVDAYGLCSTYGPLVFA